MYGTRFVQQFGWYINQTYLRLGIMPLWLYFLPDVCPAEIQERIRELSRATDELNVERDRLLAMVRGPKRADIAPTEITYWSNVKMDEARPFVLLRRRVQALRTVLENEIQNITRQEFSFRKVGEGWVSETLLYQIVRRLFPYEEIIRHHRPEWLHGLEVDIYLPRQKLAFEYQGQQHFHPIRAWGGVRALRAIQYRDTLKARYCAEAGVRLIFVTYMEPLTEEYIRDRIQNQAPGK